MEHYAQHEAAQVVAAYVALYDYTFTKHAIVLPTPLIDLIACAIRHRVPLTRAQAQHALHNNTTDVSAALVLMYETVGAQRLDHECCFDPADIAALVAVRQHCSLSLRGALVLLMQHNNA